ncbi:MAG: DUF4143 domain-containing protein [Candidatus Rokubacteria bacterium]|nr:DUF4143 domain-containing protein [Candidatus Rokubacteria bacterium]
MVPLRHDRTAFTARRYLDVLTGLFMVRQLRPWHENLRNRQVKSPMVHLRARGLLHTLLGLATGGAVT